MAVSRQDSPCFHSLLKEVLGNALRMATRAVEVLLALSPLRKSREICVSQVKTVVAVAEGQRN